MIGWLSDWLREIILVVLFAVVVDMLLPNNVMQRYIKVVISLFILLTILSPILTLLRSDFHFRDVQAELDRWSSPSSRDTVMATQNEIAKDAEKLQQAGEQQTLQWVEQRLADMMKEDLSDRGFTQVYDIRTEVEMKPSGQADIRKIQVYLQEQPTSAAVGGARTEHEGSERGRIEPIQPIEPIEPVMIDIDINLDEPSSEIYGPADDAAETDSPEIRRSIREHIMSAWGVAPEQIVFQEAAR